MSGGVSEEKGGDFLEQWRGSCSSVQLSGSQSMGVCLGGGVTVEGANTASCQVEPQTKGPRAK